MATPYYRVAATPRKGQGKEANHQSFHWLVVDYFKSNLWALPDFSSVVATRLIPRRARILAEQPMFITNSLLNPPRIQNLETQLRLEVSGDQWPPVDQRAFHALLNVQPGDKFRLGWSVTAWACGCKSSDSGEREGRTEKQGTKPWLQLGPTYYRERGRTHGIPTTRCASSSSTEM
jgi:hypothetical protein